QGTVLDFRSLTFYVKESHLTTRFKMYCPQCGQQQPDAVHYCSRCGLSLYELSIWLSGSRALTKVDVLNKQLSPRRKWILRAAKVTFFSGILLPFGFLLTGLSKEPVFLVVPLLALFVSLVWMLYCRLFVENTNFVAVQVPQRSIPPLQYVPPVQVGSPIALDAHRPNTAEMVQPPSVTEYTTNLLKKDRG
ncbi:MAG TPA: zinc ribbon domain-containing protein, partial [Pyrinomonadaceae bacterium]|nr:zinc ribbon domain-containing protein [Pyrinomonadaceae bacterium]